MPQLRYRLNIPNQNFCYNCGVKIPIVSRALQKKPEEITQKTPVDIEKSRVSHSAKCLAFALTSLGIGLFVYYYGSNVMDYLFFRSIFQYSTLIQIICWYSICWYSRLSGIEIAKLAKEWNPNLTIILGNYHTVCAEIILKNYDFMDFCVQGEGEHTILELLPAIEKKSNNYNEIKGIYYKRNGIVKSTTPRELENNLDIFPIPDRKLLEGCDYKIAIGGMEISGEKSGTIIMSRGCPFQCRFCSVNQNSWRHRSVKNIIEELELLESEGYREIMVMDDNFTLNPKWVIEVCKNIVKSKIDLVFHCEGRIEGTKEMYEYMNRANFKSIFYGMESGSQRVLDYYNKKITPDQCKMALKKA